MKPVTLKSQQALKNRYISTLDTIWFYCWTSAITALLIWGNTVSGQGYVTAESGLGYWLGIIGGTMILLLLLYSMRKRLNFLSKIFSLRILFQFHMAMGVLGPVCILFHSNFRFGSFNSSVALVCMLLVSGSGLIGRYLYNRIHYTISGHAIKLSEIRADFSQLEKDISRLASTDKQRNAQTKIFYAIEELISDTVKGSSYRGMRAKQERAKEIKNSLIRFITILEKSQLDKSLEGISDDEIKEIRARIKDYSRILMKILAKLPGLSFFERLFSLWHVIHLPIFGLMLVTAITHVVVVHMY